jgi:hypothetical protein
MRINRFGLYVVGLALATTSFAQAQSDVTTRQHDAMSQLRGTEAEVQFLFNGANIERVYGAPFGGGFSPQEAAVSFVKSYSDLFLLNEGEFIGTGTQDVSNGKFTAVYFQEVAGGVPVENGLLTVLVRNQLGNPIVLASANGRTVSGKLPRVKVSASRAILNFRQTDPLYTSFTAPILVVWLGETTQHLAWKFMATGNAYGTDLASTVWVDTSTGQILKRRNEVLDVDVSGSVKGWASPGMMPDWPGYPEVLANLPHLRVDIVGGGFAYTNTSGNYTITNAGAIPVTVTSGLVGRYSTVVTAQGVGLTSSTSVTPPGPHNIVYAAGLAQFDVGQVNAYLQTHLVHDFVKAMSPAFPGVDISLTTNVNQASTCNANFNSGNMTINFFNAGGSCPNTAYSTVVYHEYGHFIINRAGTGQGGYGEGMGDVIASLLGDTPFLGVDFQGFGTGPLRNAINTIHYPENAGSEIHTAGMIVSGAFWETVRKMDTTIGHAPGLALMRNYAVNSILLHPPGITPGLTVDVLTLDDNDANLNNGTPHYDDIAFGFGLKGLTAPPLQWLNFVPISVPTGSVLFNPNADLIIPVRLQILSNISNPVISTVRLFHRVNGAAWQQSLMTEIADPGVMAGGIEQSACGTSVDWYVSVQDDQGHTLFYPSGGAASPNNYLLGLSLSTIFADTFETVNAWTITNTAVALGGWVRGDPIGTFNGTIPAQPENDSTDVGANCYFTGQGVVGGSVGAQDLDGGPTELKSPVFNLSGSDGLIEYSRWFYSVNGVPDTFTVQVSNNGGANWATVETVSGTGNNSWIRKSFRVGAFVSTSNNMVVRFLATDNPNDSVTEAAIDNFVVKRINCP